MGDDASPPRGRPWQLLSRVVEMRSPWLAVIGERFEVEPGRIVDSWRIEKPDSVVVLTLWSGRILLPAPSYRAGIGRVTLDLAGGRIAPAQPVDEAAVGVVCRELGVDRSAVAAVNVLNETGYDVDSSASSQRLFAAVVELDPSAVLDPGVIEASYPATAAGAAELLGALSCLQCRAVVTEWATREAGSG